MTGVSKPYNQGVSIVTLNRILLILGVLGLFVSGVLTAEHIWRLEIPCNASRGCLAVAQHSSSYFYKIPVAYIGFAGYSLLTGLAIIRGFTGLYYSAFLTISGYIGAAFGMVVSLYLQYVSFTQIHAVCAWCLGSAVIMVTTFIFYTILFGRMGSSESTAEPVRNPNMLYVGLAGIMIAGSGIAGIKISSAVAEEPVDPINMAMTSRLVPEPRKARNQLGPDDAPVTVIEYADLCCPQCRTGLKKIHEVVAKYPGKIRIVYRHYPIYRLPGHEMSLQAVIASELAAQKGKFWEFADAFSAGEEAPKTMDGVVAISSQFGISGEDIDKAMKDENSVPNKNLTRDFMDSQDAFGINSTPTFMIWVKGQPVKKLSFAQFFRELDKPEMKRLLQP